MCRGGCTVHGLYGSFCLKHIPILSARAYSDPIRLSEARCNNDGERGEIPGGGGGWLLSRLAMEEDTGERTKGKKGKWKNLVW